MKHTSLTQSILYHLYATTVLLLPCQRNFTFKQLIKIVQLDTVKQPYTGFLNKETCFNTVSALTLDSNMHIQKVELSFSTVDNNFYEACWKRASGFSSLSPFPPPWAMFIPPTYLQKEWLIWKSSLISHIVPSLSFVLVLISRALLDSKEKEHGQQRNRVTQRTVSWDQLWGIWWLSASLQLWRLLARKAKFLKRKCAKNNLQSTEKEGADKWTSSSPLFHSNYYSWSALDTAVSVAKLICKETESCLTWSHILECACNWCFFLHQD